MRLLAIPTPSMIGSGANPTAMQNLIIERARQVGDSGVSGSSSENAPPFVAEAFSGERVGYVFKIGENGLGYYRQGV